MRGLQKQNVSRADDWKSGCLRKSCVDCTRCRVGSDLWDLICGISMQKQIVIRKDVRSLVVLESGRIGIRRRFLVVLWTLESPKRQASYVSGVLLQCPMMETDALIATRTTTAIDHLGDYYISGFVRRLIAIRTTTAIRTIVETTTLVDVLSFEQHAGM